MSTEFACSIKRIRFDENYQPADSTRLTTNFANLARGESREQNLRNTLRMINNRFNALAQTDNPNGDRYSLEIDIISADLDIEGQTKDILATIEQLLALAKSDKSRLLSVQLFLKDLADFPTVNAIYVDWLKDCVAPSRATIQADLVNPKWLIEIAVIAAQK